jgi:hypothetical protein
VQATPPTVETLVFAPRSAKPAVAPWTIGCFMRYYRRFVGSLTPQRSTSGGELPLRRLLIRKSGCEFISICGHSVVHMAYPITLMVDRV